MFLIQFDACNRDNLGLSSIGFVLSYETTILCKHQSIIKEAYNSNYAEYKALIASMKFAKMLNLKYLYIQGDAKVVIDQINNICKVNSDIIKPLFEEVNLLKKNFESIVFQHIYRKDNAYADSLANNALYDYVI